MIGRKKHINIVIILIIISSLNCCIFEYFEDKPDDYLYTVYFKNSSHDTIDIVLGNDSLNYAVDEFVLNPFDSVPYYSYGVNKGENVIKDKLFSDVRSMLDQARVYKSDSLVVNWYGPPREMADSIHHFFNYNSWDYWLIDKHDGIVRFTIYDEDLKK
jgi:hypothetical protein